MRNPILLLPASGRAAVPCRAEAILRAFLRYGSGLVLCAALLGGAWEAAAQPALRGFTPFAAPAGTVVTLKGSGFTGTTSVRFGEVEAPGRACRPRHRHRHRAGEAAVRLRPVLPGRRLRHARPRRHGHRAVARPRAGRAARRHRPCREHAGPGNGEPEPGAALDHTTVLVVDDNADVRALVRSLLEPRYRVLEAGDGRQGLDRAREALPDLVVADVMMPGLDGFALSRALKQEPMTDCIPVVLLTARAETEAELEGLRTGADDYVTKPFEPALLRARVDNLIRLRQRLRERLRDDARQAPPAPPPAPSSEAASPTLEALARALILANLTDPAFDVEDLARALAMSYSTLYANLRKEGSPAPNQLIRTVRVERAAELLAEGAGTISEVAYAVGFNSLTYFARCFRQHFGATPSAFARRSEGAGA